MGASVQAAAGHAARRDEGKGRPADLAGHAWYRVARIAFSLSPLLLVHLALVAVPFVPATLWSLVLLLVVTRVAGLGVTIGLHRYFSHRAFKTSRAFQFLLGVVGCT